MLDRFEFSLQISKKELSLLLKFFLFFILLFSLSFFVLWQKLRYSALVYNMDNVLQLKKEKYLYLEKLQYNLKNKMTISQIEKTYREKFGFVPVSLHRKIISIDLSLLSSASK